MKIYGIIISGTMHLNIEIKGMVKNEVKTFPQTITRTGIFACL